MAEPLLIYSEVPLSFAAFKRWLALPSASVENDRPTGAENFVGSVCGLIASYIQRACDPATGNYLMCRYDRTQKALQFAACLYDGSTSDAREDARRLAAIARSAIACQRGNAKSGYIVAALDELNWPPAQHVDEGRTASLGKDHVDVMPAWFVAWTSALATLGPLESQMEWIDRLILDELRQNALLQQASPERPVRIGWLYTDGQQVYASVAGKSFYVDDPDAPDGQRMERTPDAFYFLEGANPRTMRALCDDYYTDGNLLWHCNIFSGEMPQALAYCKGHTPSIYKFVDSSIDSLVVMGDSAWNVAYDDSKPPQHRYHVRHTAIDGNTFERIAATRSFRDCRRRYAFDERTGLCPVEEP